MTIADQARNLAISLEAKKDALAQRQNGDWKVSFTVQGIDMNPRLTQAAMGTRYAMVLVEIGDDELPVHQPEKETKSPIRTPVNPQPDTDKPSAGVKRMDWRDVQPAAQASIRADDPIFVAFLKEEWPDFWRAHKDANECIRGICMVASKRELGTDHKKRVLWHQLDSQFSAWLAKERVGA